MKLLTTIAVGLFSAFGSLNAAQIDLGITLGSVLGAGNTVLSDARVELGTFTGYTDSSGSLNASFFTGKDYTTLRASYISLPLMEPTQPLVTDIAGGIYTSFDLLSTPVNTRVFAWIHSTSTASSSANWAVITGGANAAGANAYAYNPMWLAVAPSASDLNVIEAATIYSQIAASSPGASIIANTSIDPEGANISLVPEPSTGALMMIGAAGLVALRRLRKV